MSNSFVNAVLIVGKDIGVNDDFVSLFKENNSLIIGNKKEGCTLE